MKTVPKRNALIVRSSGAVESLVRVPFASGSFSEEWLQRLIEDNPNIIPSSEFGVQYSPLVCIGREVPVGSSETHGYIDNLYVTPSGNIVIVETKLFRNQEARRTVVAQIIDYAKELQKWDSKRLNKVAAKYFYKKLGQSFNIIDIMARHGFLTFSDEGKLNDALNKNLENASFLLMIIGDGIRTGVRELAYFLNENSSMPSDLALVELEIYESGADTIVIPNVVTQTSVIERYSYDRDEPSHTPYIKKPILPRSEFLTIFAEKNGLDPDEVIEFVNTLEAIPGFTVGIQPTEITLKFSPSASNRLNTLFTISIAKGYSDIWLIPSSIKAEMTDESELRAADRFLSFYEQFVDIDRCVSKPYVDENRFYFANVNDLFNFTQEFISAAEQFAIAFTHN